MELRVREDELNRQNKIRSRDFELVRRAQSGDNKAATQLIQQMAGVLRIHAKRNLLRYGLDFDESMQYGMMGILRAISKFDCTKGANFCTYASTWIRVASLGPRGRNTLDHADYIDDLFPMGNDKSGKRNHIPLPSQLTFSDSPDEALDAARHRAILDEAIDKNLRPLEAAIIRLRMRGLSFEDIAEEFGVSRQRIQQVESDAMKKLRKLNLGGRT